MPQKASGGVTVPRPSTCLDICVPCTVDGKQFLAFTGPLSEVLPRLQIDMRVSKQVPDQELFFLPRPSTDRCKEKIRKVASKHIKVLICHALHSNNDISTLSRLDDLLEPRISASLTEISQLDPKNCRPNEEFTVMLKRKLRLLLWPQQRLHCSRGKIMD